MGKLSEPGVLFLHEVNLLEIYYGVYRDEGEQLAEETYDKVINLPIKIVAGSMSGDNLDPKKPSSDLNLNSGSYLLIYGRPLAPIVTHVPRYLTAQRLNHLTI